MRRILFIHERSEINLGTVLLEFSVDPQTRGFWGVPFLVTHGIPVFPDRSVVTGAAGIFVNACVSLEHATKIAKFDRTPPPALRLLRCQDRIIQEARKLPRQFLRISGAKSYASFSEYLGEGPQVGRDDQQPAQHVFGHDQAKNLSTHRRDDDNGSFRKSSIEFPAKKPPGKSNAPCKRCGP